MGKIFHVRVNLDDISADNDTLANDEERGQWLRGFLGAARGGTNRFADGSPGAMGHKVGMDSLESAMRFSAMQSSKGQKSAEARKVNHGSTTVHPRLESGSTVDEPQFNLSSNLISSNLESKKLISNLSSDKPDNGFEKFWNTYGKKDGKPATERAWNKLSQKDRQAALAAIPAYHVAKPDRQFRKNPQGWLNGRHWEDESLTASSIAPPPVIDYGKAPPINFGAM